MHQFTSLPRGALLIQRKPWGLMASPRGGGTTSPVCTVLTAGRGPRTDADGWVHSFKRGRSDNERGDNEHGGGDVIGGRRNVIIKKPQLMLDYVITIGAWTDGRWRWLHPAKCHSKRYAPCIMKHDK